MWLRFSFKTITKLEFIYLVSDLNVCVPKNKKIKK